MLERILNETEDITGYVCAIAGGGATCKSFFFVILLLGNFLVSFVALSLTNVLIPKLVSFV